MRESFSDTHFPEGEEKRLQDFWEQDGTNRFDLASTDPVYSIDTPPPTVSGGIHIGHIFSYTQAEVVARYQRMHGKNVFYPFGFDDNGLPTERLVEKNIGHKAQEIGREAFTDKCVEITAEYRRKFKVLWRSLGLSVDWDYEYSTISPEVRRASQGSFLSLLKQGNITKVDAPTLWCPECQTAVAQAEVDQKESPSSFHTIKFTTEDGENVEIATTRPELLPACVAVFVNPTDERYKHLVGKNITTPLGDTVKILEDEAVDIGKGTGVVMCCSYGDEQDMRWIKEHKLPTKVIIGRDGRMSGASVEELNGMSTNKARATIVEKLKSGGSLVNSAPIKHDIGVHERCGTPIEIMPVSQWFVKIMEMKAKLLERADEIKWHPGHMKLRYVQWVNNLKWDWAISRQRYYGVPIPVWYSKKTGEIILPDESQLPIDTHAQLPLHLPEGHTADDIVADADVLDTWATSSLTPQINAKKWGGQGQELHDRVYPMDLRPQAHDIIRTWALYTIVMSELHEQSIPWENIMISGHVLARKGEKLSKKTGGKGPGTPEEFIEKYSADAVRYWACGASLGRDVIFDENEILKGKKLVTKLWNAARLAVGNLEDFDPAKDMVAEADMEPTDQWLLLRIKEVSDRMAQAFDQCEVGTGRQEFEAFFWKDFCDNYLELIKPRLYSPDAIEGGEKKRRSAQSALYQGLKAVLQFIAPYMPHVSEGVYQRYYKEYEPASSIHRSQYPRGMEGNEGSRDQLVRSGMNHFLSLIDYVRCTKTSEKISFKAEIEGLEICGPEDVLQLLEPFTDDIKGFSKARNLTFKQGESLEFHLTQ